MGKVTFSAVEEEIIDSMMVEFGIPRLQAIDHFIELKRATMKAAAARGDIEIAKQLQQELGE